MHKRIPEIDILKGLLTIGMIFDHVYTILGDGKSQAFSSIGMFVDWTAFSGFFFCFGFAMWVAYLQKAKIPWANVVKTATKSYIVFVISGVASRIFLSSEDVSLSLIYRISMLRDIPPFSEFLLSFVTITIVGAILKRCIYWITNRWYLLLFGMGICFVLTFLLQGGRDVDPLISLFIGSKKFLVFPIIQYLPLFLLGVFVARNPLWFNMKIYLFFSVFGFILRIFSIFTATPISRFPPSIIWILCSIGFIFLYRGFAEIIQENLHSVVKQYLTTVGKNVLFYFLVSNLIIFISYLYRPSFGLNSLETMVMFIFILSFIFFIQSISSNKSGST